MIGSVPHVVVVLGTILFAPYTQGLSTSTQPLKKKKVVVIGGGWAGFSAADALSSMTVKGLDDDA